MGFDERDAGVEVVVVVSFGSIGFWQLGTQAVASAGTICDKRKDVLLSTAACYCVDSYCYSSSPSMLVVC